MQPIGDFTVEFKISCIVHVNSMEDLRNYMERASNNKKEN